MFESLIPREKMGRPEEIAAATLFLASDDSSFERGFVGMTRLPVVLDDLLAAREALISEMVGVAIDMEIGNL
ncbi:Hypothetical protein NGAL_HAMBI2605_17320 [Neorhizobium galegae bv. orientalis]|nr:Hypothetical protein NGAL_HAMBI2566_26040 [Neorhizobium galegae bv. orientalis]CDZ61936.1 Hypothetical protein NGAL_HAMBI2605_17320 [Neorhizobium galegae bv. orientalis]